MWTVWKSSWLRLYADSSGGRQTHTKAASHGFFQYGRYEAETPGDAEEYCACNGEGQSSKGEDIILGMKAYAQKNYYMDISVKMLAEKVFFMNAAYLSHLFAEKTGISSSPYIRH